MTAAQNTVAGRTVHFHSSDERCCRSAGPRQFTLNDDEVTCVACRPRIFAMLSPQGTACAETALYDDENTPKQRALIEAKFCLGGSDDPVAGSWTDCSDNEALTSKVQP